MEVLEGRRKERWREGTYTEALALRCAVIVVIVGKAAWRMASGEVL